MRRLFTNTGHQLHWLRIRTLGKDCRLVECRAHGDGHAGFKVAPGARFVECVAYPPRSVAR